MTIYLAYQTTYLYLVCFKISIETILLLIVINNLQKIVYFSTINRPLLINLNILLIVLGILFSFFSSEYACFLGRIVSPCFKHQLRHICFCLTLPDLIMFYNTALVNIT